MRDKERINKDSYVIKNGHIDCKKDTYDIFQNILATLINNDLEYLTRKDYYKYFKWEVDGKLAVSYERKNNYSLKNYISYISIPTRILVSSGLVFLQQLLEKITCLDTGVIYVCYLLQITKKR